MTRFFMAFAVLFLLYSCKTEVAKNIADRGSLINEEYKAVKLNITNLEKVIMANAELQEDLKIKPDTVTDGNIDLEVLLAKATPGETPFTGKANYLNFIYLNNLGNIDNYAFMKPDGATHNFELQVKDTISGAPHMDVYLWQSHINKVAKDSVTEWGAKELKAQLDVEKMLFSGIKYIVATNDIMYLPPKMLGRDTFESGMLVTKVKVYNAQNGNKIAQTVITSVNSNEIKTMLNGVSGEINLQTVVLNLRSETKKQIEEFLGIAVD
jgi:hypothetical protein